MLHESIRKKSEKEKHFEERKKKLMNREKKIEQREKELKEKLKQFKPNKRKDNSNVNVSKPNRRIISQTQSKDPLHAYRNMLPYHWICIFLIAVLMIAIAQRK